MAEEAAPMRARRLRGAAVTAVVALPLLGAPASAAVPHTVQPGETLWSIAAANNFTTRTIAAFNGLPLDARVVAGTTIRIPTEAEGAATLEGGAGSTRASTTGGAAHPPSPPPPASRDGLPPDAVPIHHPTSTPYLRSDAAAAWAAMRQESLRKLGVDLYPLGPASGYRSREQQQYFWRLYRSGQGSPASPPGTSSHELGTAIDVPTLEMRRAIDRIGARFGWRKVEAPSEWWHVNYVGGYSG